MAIRHVDVVMAIYRPDRERLELQIDSILRQVGVTLRIFVFADGEMPDVDSIRYSCLKHPEVQFIHFPQNRGPAEAFIDGLEHVLRQGGYGEGRYFSFSDQDDIWDPDKLLATVTKLEAENSSAAHSDARLVDVQGKLLAPSMFDFEQRIRTANATSLFFRNNATGMTMVFDKSTAELAVQLRDLRPNCWLHDQFVAMIAISMFGISLVERPLVSYVQHASNVVGAFKMRSGFEIIYNVIRHICKAKVWSRDYLLQGRQFVAALQARTLDGPGVHQLAELSLLLHGEGIMAIFRVLRHVWSRGPSDLVSIQLLLDKLGDPRTRGAWRTVLC